MRRKRMHGRRRRSPMRFGASLNLTTLLKGSQKPGAEAEQANQTAAEEVVDKESKGDLDHTHKDNSEAGNMKKNKTVDKGSAQAESARGAAKAMGQGGQNDGAWGRNSGGW